MGELLNGKFGSQARRAKNARSSLCANGHHRWEVDKASRFDVKAGKLVTIERCQRCGTTRKSLR
ncbi:MAG: hypothetical protein KJP25_01025 [Gammaproteobacteria bacterium]|nr:hypothetical protein [Gammaproteobacteria bacterium]MBT8152281.1 hypothetical protein [Gammaproteobacteria bacterium]NND39386.1 hypothetical protein [Pseudomonadales bacterium]NNM11347.1 hypothetical protein [Pseudomonadales bacterium]RZV58165.1 MAG: hypothetical protein EX270_03045 [Pseudomonadales bacterium]